MVPVSSLRVLELYISEKTNMCKDLMPFLALDFFKGYHVTFAMT